MHLNEIADDRPEPFALTMVKKLLAAGKTVKYALVETSDEVHLEERPILYIKEHSPSVNYYRLVIDDGTSSITGAPRSICVRRFQLEYASIKRVDASDQTVFLLLVPSNSRIVHGNADQTAL